MEQLINFDGLGEIIVNLTNKLADGVGWIANRETPKKLAINTYIKEIQQKDYDSITKAALISNAKKIIKEYCNQKDIVDLAIQSLQSDASPEKVEDDWLVKFMDKAKHVSSQEFQLIWGKILARECNKPGSIPLGLLYTLEKMDKEDAEAFTALCKVAVQFGEDYSPIVIQRRLEEYKQFGITLNNLIDLNALGLVEMDLGPFSDGYSLMTYMDSQKVTYYDLEHEFLEKKELRVGNVLFTKPGNALCHAIEADKIDGFWENFCLPFWQQDNKESDNGKNNQSLQTI
jgi:hypothetical protein